MKVFGAVVTIYSDFGTELPNRMSKVRAAFGMHHGLLVEAQPLLHGVEDARSARVEAPGGDSAAVEAVALQQAVDGGPDPGADYVGDGRVQHDAEAAGGQAEAECVEVLDFGREFDRPYVVTKLIEGDDTAKVLGRDGALRPHVAVDYARQAATGLRAGCQRKAISGASR